MSDFGLPPIAALDPDWRTRAAARQAERKISAGLGRLLPLGQQLCAIQETLEPRGEPAAVVILAGDHGIAEEHVSAFSQEMTGRRVLGALRGEAAVNVLARRAGVRVLVADLGVKHLPEEARQHPDLHSRPLGPGTHNFARQPAMSEAQALQAIRVGGELVDSLIAAGVRVVVVGGLGVGNTSSASAIASCLTREPVVRVLGHGSGIDDETWQRKRRLIGHALCFHLVDAGQPLQALATFGGFEIAGLVGVVLHAAAKRRLVVLDGFVSSVAALVTVRMCPAVRDYLVSSHLGTEPGHVVALEALDLPPALALDIRSEDGVGGVLALPLVQAAADLMRA